MSYIGNVPYQVAFVTDTFSGNATTTAFTMSVAPANTSSVLVAVTGVLQDPSTYSVSGTTLTFSAAPPTGTGNISVRYLGIPASGVTTTAYRTVTQFTATAGQTTFTPPSYTAGFINVYRNGVLLGTADYTATNGTTVVLASGATSGDLVTVESFLVSSVLNAIPATAGSVSDSNIVSMTGSKLTGTQTVPKATLPTGCILQVVNGSYSTTTFNSTSSYIDTGLTASITPTSSTSKILVVVNQADPFKSVGNASSAINIKLVRNATDLITFGLANCYTGTSAQMNGTSIGTTYLDSPATTSATTYKTQFANYTNAAQVGVQATGAASTITLMEISA